MGHRSLPFLYAFLLGACATAKPAPGSSTASDAPEEGAPGEEPTDENEFKINASTTAKDAHGVNPSKIERTETEAAVRLFVVDKKQGPIPGIVIKLTGSKGASFYAEETDAKGYTELLLPIADDYELVYLGLGGRDRTKKVTIPDAPNQNIKLTLVYNRENRTGSEATGGFVLDGVEFDTDKATIRPGSYPRLDTVVEYMAHKKSARIEISGHTDNQGNPKANKTLSQKRAQACKKYLVSKGIDAGRIETVGHGQDKPVAPNDTPEGRQKNRRIEAREL